jgi:hypothetical protein
MPGMKRIKVKRFLIETQKESRCMVMIKNSSDYGCTTLKTTKSIAPKNQKHSHLMARKKKILLTDKIPCPKSMRTKRLQLK